jgi:hypothetical protein
VADKIHRLHAVPPTHTPETRRAVIVAELELLLKEAREGDISEIVVLIQHANPKEYSTRTSNVESVLTWVGRLEQLKLDLLTLMKEKEDL